MVETITLAAFSSGLAGSMGSAMAIGETVGGVGSLLSFGSAAGSILGGFQGQATSNMQARQAELSAKQEELKGRETAATIRRQLSSSLASQNAIFAARGINPNGMTRTIANESSSQAARDINIAQFGATQAAGALRSQSQQYKIEGKAKVLSGFTSAAKSAYSLV